MDKLETTTAASRALFALALLTILVLATLPFEETASALHADKLNHLLAFFALGLLSDFAFPRQAFGWPKILPLLTYGIGIEAIQYFLPLRTFSLADLLANALGLACYALALPLLRKIPILSWRWKL